ncbi:MAG: glyoxalase/bleomycin resistance protein/dioxygenase [Massilia sp.]|nr:glyoxalase/bleomycin resistance protein/dioxygenase [Massilia sp.]
MGIRQLDHYSVRTADLARAIRFYEDALGFHSGPRPPFNFPGAWMYTAPQMGESGESEGRPIVHLIGDDGAHGGNTTGALDHIAFAASGVKELHARLERHGLAFRERKVPNLGLHQVFVKDPDGVTIELNYADAADIAAGQHSLDRRSAQAG